MATYRLPRPLDPIETRILGCLVEKELSNPDSYPLTLNTLTAAINQKSNRDPVFDLGQETVESALVRLLPEVLVWRVRSTRVLRWQHNLDSKWELAPGEKAILAELLLRGEQTPGELRSRASRMREIDDLSTVHEHLDRLAGPDLALVEELPRQPGQKESRWRHLLGETAPAEQAPTVTRESGTEEKREKGEKGRGDEEKAEVLECRLAALESRVEDLAAELALLRHELGAD